MEKAKIGDKQGPQDPALWRRGPRVLAIAAVLLLLLILAMLGFNSAIVVGQIGAEAHSAAAQRLDALSIEVAQDYPDVRHISVAELKRDFGSALLVDVRELDEFELSHLPGAVHAPTPAAVDALRLANPQQALVFYCTVGVRSAIAVRKLRERMPNSGTAVNLAGSIFAWANAGEALQDAAGPTSAVHPYNRWWSMRYLDQPLAESGAKK